MWMKPISYMRPMIGVLHMHASTASAWSLDTTFLLWDCQPHAWALIMRCLLCMQDSIMITSLLILVTSAQSFLQWSSQSSMTLLAFETLHSYFHFVLRRETLWNPSYIQMISNFWQRCCGGSFLVYLLWDCQLISWILFNLASQTDTRNMYPGFS